MKKHLVWMLAGGMSVSACLAQNADAGVEKKRVWRFGVQVPVWARVRASFSAHSAGNPGIVDGTAADSARDRFYDDGYVRVNSLGNPPLGGLLDTFPRTSFYRYDNASQATAPDNTQNTITLNAPGLVRFHSVSFDQGGDFGSGQNNHGLPGLELFVRRDIETRKKRLRVAMEAGVSWNHLTWGQQGSVPIAANVIEDTYNTGTVDATGRAGLEGVFDPILNPFPQWIGSTPTRTTFLAAGTLTGSRRLTLDAFQVRVGPSVGVKLTPRLHLDGLAGLWVGFGFSSFNYQDTLTFAGGALGPLNQQGDQSDSHAWFGLYTALRLSYDLTEHWQALLEARYLWSDTLTHRGAARAAAIRFADGFSINLGVSRLF